MNSCPTSLNQRSKKNVSRGTDFVKIYIPPVCLQVAIESNALAPLPIGDIPS
jgi:hypothetical protein